MKQDIHFKQAKFIEKLARYINGGNLSKFDIFINLISRRFVFYKNAFLIIRDYKKVHIELRSDFTKKQKIIIEPYRGANVPVLKMIGHLDKLTSNDLVGAYLHGSLGNGEENAYSDFDALVILKDDLFLTPFKLAQAALILNDGITIMKEQDSLQHHGWFVITESDLKNYPETYFPVELFKYSKKIFGSKSSEVEFNPNNKLENFDDSLRNLCASIAKKIDNKSYPKTYYQLKVLLSEIMLLPTFYIQARDKKGVFKKFSFEMASGDFSAWDWEIINFVSAWRLSWHFNNIEKHLEIDSETRNKISDDFRSKTSELIKKMIAKVSAC